MLRDTFFVAFADYIAYGIIFVLTILINRNYGTTELGYFSFAYAFSTLLIYSVNGAFSAIIKRDVAVYPERSGEYVGSFLTLRVTVTVILGLAMYIVVFALPNATPALTQAVLLVFGIKAIEGLSEVFYAIFQATSKMVLYAVLKSTQQGVFLVVSVVTMVSGGSASTVYGAGVVVAIIFFILVMILSKWIYSDLWRIEISLIRYAIVESWPLLINALVFALTTRLGILLINALEGSTVGGTYAAALNIISGVSLLPGAVGVVLFPILSRMYATKPNFLGPYMHRLTFQLGMIGAVFTLLVFLLSSSIIQLYGVLPPEAAGVLKVLALGLVFVFAQPPSGYMFTAIHRQREGMLYAIVMLVACLPLYYALTVIWGVHGTAWAFVVHQALWVVGAYAWVKRFL
jgi:PST family polysaccharide transporter